MTTKPLTRPRAGFLGEKFHVEQNLMKTPLYTISYPAGYYALENTVTGRIIRTPYDTLDVSEDFIRNKYRKAFARTVTTDSLGRVRISK